MARSMMGTLRGSGTWVFINWHIRGSVFYETYTVQGRPGDQTDLESSFFSQVANMHS